MPSHNPEQSIERRNKRGWRFKSGSGLAYIMVILGRCCRRHYFMQMHYGHSTTYPPVFWEDMEVVLATHIRYVS